MSHRAGIIASNDPDLTGRLTRRGFSGRKPVDGAFNLSIDGPSISLNGSAMTSLMRLKHMGHGQFEPSVQTSPDQASDMTSAGLNPSDSDAMLYGLALTPAEPKQKAGAQAVESPGSDDEQVPLFDIWLQSTVAHSENANNKATVGLLHIGADYLVTPSLVVGMMGQLDWMDQEDKVGDIAVDGLGWMVGPYMVARLGEKLYFDGRATWGQSDNSISPFGTYEDDFETTRWMVKGQLTGAFSVGKLTVSPMVRGLYFKETQEAYIDSQDNEIPKQTISLGRLTFGPTFSTSHTTDSGLVVEPSLAVHGVWDFDPADLVDIDTGASLVSSEEVHARIETGLTMRYGERLSVTGTAFYDGLGVDDSESYGLKGKVVLPLN